MELAAFEHLKSPNRFIMFLRRAIVALWATFSESSPLHKSDFYKIPSCT